MLLSEIKKVIKREVSIVDFKKEISTEVEKYKKLSKQKGARNPIFLKEDIEYFFTVADFQILENLIKTGELSEYEGSYIADAILLSSKIEFSDPSIIDQIESLVVEEW